MLRYTGLHAEMYAAIESDERIKKSSREWKIRLIEEMNPEWKDLAREAIYFLKLGPRPRLKHSGVTFLRGDDHSALFQSFPSAQAFMSSTTILPRSMTCSPSRNTLQSRIGAS